MKGWFLGMALLASNAQAQSLFTDAPLEGAWVDPATGGQGVTIEMLPDGRRLFVAWFTYAGDGSGEQRWYSAVLTLTGSTGTGPLHRSLGGRRNAPGVPVTQDEVGTLSIDFPDCRTAVVAFALTDGDDRQHGRFVAHPARELVPDAPHCSAVTKLRWPTAAPTLDDAEYAAHAAKVFVIANFAQHQGGVTDRPAEAYFHDGLDIFGDNGTPIYALESGTVRHVQTAGTDAGQTVTVESDGTPNEGWSYIHIVPTVATGARVEKGQRLGTVQFRGIEHLHLSRIRRVDASWSFERLVTVNPMPWFTLPDAEPPSFRDGVIVMRDGSDEVLPDGAPIFGKVDLLVGIRDTGPNARSPRFGTLLGDRHAVTWADYEIEGNGVRVRQRAIDFNQLELPRIGTTAFAQTPITRVLYQPTLLVPVDAPERVYSYYLLTHGTAAPRVDLAQSARHWDTTQGPNGTYTIRVRAADANGNVGEFTDTVEVRND